MGLRLKAELFMSYYLRPQTFDDLIQQPKKDFISICNCISIHTFWGVRIVSRDCVKELRQDFKLKCGACYVNEMLDETPFDGIVLKNR